MSIIIFSSLAIALFSLLGKMLAVWQKKDPPGFSSAGNLSESLRQSTNWQLPLIVLGGIFIFIYNLAVYFVYGLSSFLHFLADLILWVYENVIRQTIVFIWKMFVHYVVLIPFKVLAATVNGTIYIFNWMRYKSLIFTAFIFYGATALLVFFLYFLEIYNLEIILLVAASLLATAYVTGLHAGKSKSAGITSLTYMGGYLLIIVILAGFTYVFNQADGIKNWGAVISGVLYSPSVLAISLSIVLLLLSFFISNAGAVYFGTAYNEGLFKFLKGAVTSLFNRSWYYLLQPLFTLLVAAILFIIPLMLFNNSTDLLNDIVVQPVVEKRSNEINLKLKETAILDKVDRYLSADSAASSFEAAKAKIEKEIVLNEELEQHMILKNYVTETISFTSMPRPVMRIEERTANKKAAEQKYTSAIENINNAVKKYKDDLSAKKVTLQQMVFDTTGSSDQYAQQLRIEIKNLDTTINRLEGIGTALTSASAKYVKLVDERNLSYNLTYFGFLVAKVILFSLLMAIFLGIWASSSALIYPMRNESYLIRWVSDEKQRNPYQPWAAWFCLLAIGFASLNGSKMLSLGSLTQGLIPQISNSESVSEMEASVNQDPSVVIPDDSETDIPVAEQIPAVDSGAVAMSEPESTEGISYSVIVNQINVYENPDASSRTIGSIDYGEQVKVLGSSNGWALISYYDNSINETRPAYVMMDEISPQ
ncbi:MAG: SH3 domain-containing protein [Bacteroidota bacterium]|jgi:hypothetical protein